MKIKVLRNNTLMFGEFKFKCCVGKNGFSQNKYEGDKKTPIGTFDLGSIYYRDDKFERLNTNLETIKIRKNMGWCDDVNSKSKYNKFIRIDKNIKHEKLYRKDYKYDLLIPIKYNNISLSITERECKLILFINKSKKASLENIQKKVWGHLSKLETHTVETHIYRLRKKFLSTFKDEKFIKLDKDGYYLNC